MLAPHNTLRSIEVALQLGVDMIEFDVRRCRDTMVLLHDADLKTPSGGSGRVRDYTLAELRKLDVSSGYPTPTLQEAVSLIKGRAQMNVDLKETGYEGELLRILRHHNVLGDILISSLIPASLRTLKKLAPEVQVALSYPSGNQRGVISLMPWPLRLTIPWHVVRMVAAAHADAIMLHHHIITPQTVTAAHRRGYRAFAWTVDDPAEMKRLKQMGIDGITSDRPDLLMQLP